MKLWKKIMAMQGETMGVRYGDAGAHFIGNVADVGLSECVLLYANEWGGGLYEIGAVSSSYFDFPETRKIGLGVGLLDHVPSDGETVGGWAPVGAQDAKRLMKRGYRYLRDNGLDGTVVGLRKLDDAGGTVSSAVDFAELQASFEREYAALSIKDKELADAAAARIAAGCILSIGDARGEMVALSDELGFDWPMPSGLPGGAFRVPLGVRELVRYGAALADGTGHVGRVPGASRSVKPDRPGFCDMARRLGIVA